MKRYGNLYEKVYSMDNLILAHKKARRGKRWYPEVKKVDKKASYYLKKLQQDLKNKTYRTSNYETFNKTDCGKERLIYKLPYYPDRICQWALMLVIEPYLMKNLTADTYSAIKGRGIHYGLKRVTRDLKSDPKGCKYCLKIDIKKYYPSIDHRLLKIKYRSIFKDEDLLWLIEEIIDSSETGIPIGNFLSQWSANIYLSDFDHWIKEAKGVKHYHRYMDDIVIFSDSKEELRKLLRDIRRYLRIYKLEVKSNYQIFPTFIRGLDFLGYRFFQGYILLRKRTYMKMRRKMKAILRKIMRGGMINSHEWGSINSYDGWLKWCNSFRLRREYISPLLPYVKEYNYDMAR